MTELEEIHAAQDALAAFKQAVKNIQAINTKAGRNEAANSAMGILGKAMVLHAEATEALSRHYPQLADGVMVRGGGGSGR